jgi:DNA-binding transcriptional regulator YiaG
MDAKPKNELRLLMERKNLSDRDVARMLDVSETTVRIWKSNSEKSITEKDLLLLRYLVVDIDR